MGNLSVIGKVHIKDIKALREWHVSGEFKKWDKGNWYTNGMVLKGAMHMSQRKVSTTHATAEQQSEQKICNEQVAVTFYIPANTKKIKEKEDSW